MTEPVENMRAVKLVLVAAGLSFAACLAAYVTAFVLMVQGEGLAALLVALVASFLVGFAARLTDHAGWMMERDS